MCNWIAYRPLTPNGASKLDRNWIARQALPAPDATAYAAPAYEAPQGEVEHTIAAIWRDLLGLESIGRHDNFFALGGHSLLAVTLNERMRQQGLQADLRTLFTTPTLIALAAASGAVSVSVPPNRIGPDSVAITPEMLPLVALTQEQIDRIVAMTPGGSANIQDIYPLAPLQEGIFFHHLMQQQGDAYLLPNLIAFDSRSRLDRFVDALQRVIDRHDILRTAIAWEGLAAPVQVVWRHAPLPIEEVCLDDAEGDAAAQLQSRFDPRHWRMDMRQAPLMRGFAMQDSSSGRWLLQLLSHHAALDHTTLEIVLEEVSCHLCGEADTLPAPLPFRNFVAQALLGVSREEHEAYFRTMLADVDEPCAPFGLVDGQGDGSDVEQVRVNLHEPLSALLRSQARTLGVSTASLFHLAWAQVVARTTCHERVVFGTVLFGRMQGGVGADRALGMFINTLPLRIEIDASSVVESVHLMQQRLAELLRHEHASLSLVQRCSGVPAPAPLFTSLLNYRHRIQAEGAAEAMAWEGIETMLAHGRTSYPLMVAIDDVGSGFALTVQAQRPLVAERICAFLVKALERLTDALAHAPQTTVRNLDVLPEAERQQVLMQWNATTADYPRDACVHELFEVQVARDPSAIALVQGEESLTYGELNARANRLAHYLGELGVRPDDRVAICLERGIAAIVAMLGVLKSGAAYVPLDPTSPGNRLLALLDDCRASVVIVDQSLPTTSRDGLTLPIISVTDLVLIQRATHNPDIAGLQRQHLAYVMYTSGSTGQPKATMITHQGLVAYAAALSERCALQPGDTSLVFTSLHFDLALTGVYPPLLCGGTVQLCAHDSTPADWAHALRQGRAIAPLKLTPSHLTLLQQELGDTPLDGCVRVLVLGGEAPSVDAVRWWRERSPSTQIFNHYGPTETTVGCLMHALCGDEDRIPLGLPLAGVRVYVLDVHGQLCPHGVPGELYIAGHGLARGYLGRADLTAERFVPDPFAQQPGQRMYRSGDLVRWRADGTLEFLGRNDDQIKLRGFRIELGEIQAALRACDGVRDAVVIARQYNAGELRLVAYVVGDVDGIELNPEAVRTQLGARLPDYMVPSAYVHLDLPAPDATAYAAPAYEAPQGEVEHTIAAIWRDLLGLESIGRHDNFFALGGHSLLAVTLNERMRQQGLQADLRTLFTTPTLIALAAASGAVSVSVPPNRIGPDSVAITPEMLPLVALTQEQIDRIVAMTPGGSANIQDIYPLAPLQEGIFFHHLMQQQGDAYLLPNLIAFDSRSRLDRFVDALQRVIDRHDILRTAIAWEGLAAPVQVVWRHAPLPIEEVCLDDAEGDAAAQLQSRFDPRHWRMDMRQAPLMRGFAMQDSSSGRWLLQLLSHHAALDHTTLEIVLEEVSCHLCGEADTLPAPLPFRNFVAQALLGVSREEHEAYFRTMLADVDEPCAPFGLVDGQGDGSDVEQVRVNLHEPLSALLRSQARTLGVSTASLFHLAWAQVVARTTCHERVVFGTVLFGRMQGGVGADRALGMFINTLPLRIEIDASSVVESVHLMQQRLAELLRHEHASLSLVQRCSGVPAPAPLFTSLLNYRHRIQAEGAAEAMAWEGIETMLAHGRTSYPLMVAIDDVGSGFALTVQAQRPLVAERICAFLVKALERLTDALAHAPQTTVRNLDVLPEAERQQVLMQWNATTADYPRDACVHELFEVQVARDPSAIALVQGEESLTYGELNARANRLAHYLGELGVRPDDRVAICLERGIAAIVAMLGVLKSGAAYVPLDPTSPGNRLLALLDDCRASVVIVDQSLPTTSRDGLTLPIISVTDLVLIQRATHNPDIAGLQRQHLAYVMYTSGSTGQPKATMITHQGLVAYAAALSERCALQPGDTSLVFTSLHFDLALTGVYPPLLCGGTVQLCAHDSTPADWAHALRQGRAIAPLKLTPSHLTLLQQELGDTPLDGCVRVLVLGGEAPSVDAVRWWRERSPSTQIFNHYGPTETTVGCLMHALCGDEDRIPLGLPLAGVRVYVLDVHGQLCPHGVPGELYIAGHGLARGYLGRADLTAERFVPDPFAQQPGQRMYRSGDLVRWRADGTLEFLGRNDDQIKLRGFRIELGEIQAALRACDGVRDAVVIARQYNAGELRLVAYVVGDVDGIELNPEAVRTQLGARLPDYMVPSAYVHLDDLPLTPNGKLDRKALPAPDAAAYAARAYEAPQGAIEQTIARDLVRSIGSREHRAAGQLLRARAAGQLLRARWVDIRCWRCGSPRVCARNWVSRLAWPSCLRMRTFAAGGAGRLACAQGIGCRDWRGRAVYACDAARPCRLCGGRPRPARSCRRSCRWSRMHRGCCRLRSNGSGSCPDRAAGAGCTAGAVVCAATALVPVAGSSRASARRITSAVACACVGHWIRRRCSVHWTVSWPDMRRCARPSCWSMGRRCSTFLLRTLASIGSITICAMYPNARRCCSNYWPRRHRQHLRWSTARSSVVG
ncbi:non-ribosomal peptide synthetase [Xanthomonas sp. MUS 060]|uniref:non-ribosomal peptide synthetase n=1 Tax=Xanthomonas sp. MUS 060 TaxID=1588031 RepID=UPI0006975A82|nr:non-ribosomal peptide synthetase [Xanthomonas sp. MUS 060]